MQGKTSIDESSIVVFTICSVNYLAQAKSFYDSLQKFHANITFNVGLCDTLADKALDYTKIGNLPIIEVHRIGIPDFVNLCQHYDITELNTAIKPYFFNYFLRDLSVKQVFYFDPDILIFSSLNPLFETLNSNNFVLTPHITTPLPTDGLYPDQTAHLETGVFNLGFIGIKNNKIGKEMANWWGDNLAKECIIDLENGLFVDQKWIDLVPNLFKGVAIVKNLGYNVAYWNFHERKLELKQNLWYINQNTPLCFFHFSGFQLKNKTFISKYQNRFTFENRPDLISIFDIYQKTLELNHNQYFEKFQCVYVKKKSKPKYLRIRKLMTYPLEVLRRLIAKV